MKYFAMMLFLCVQVMAIDFFEKDNIFSAGPVLKVYDLNVSSVSNAFHHEPMVAYGGRFDFLIRDNYRLGGNIFRGIQFTREDTNFDAIFGGISWQKKLNKRYDKDILMGFTFGYGRYLIDDPLFTEQRDNFLYIEPTCDMTLFRINNFHMELNLSYMRAFHSDIDFGGFGGGISFLFSNKYR